MRKYRTIFVCTGVIALLIGALAGCGEQPPQEEGPEGPLRPEVGEAETSDDAGTDDTAAGEPADGEARMLADVIGKWPSSFIMTATIEEKDSGTTHTSTVAMKMGETEPLRMKTEMDEGGMIMDYEDDVMYTWDAASGVAMKMDIPETEEGTPNPYEDIDPDTRITGSETINGVDCWVAETTDDDGNTITTWVAKDNGLMQRMESDDVIVNYEYEQIGSVPDSEFELPEGMTVQEMPAMGEMPEGMPGQ